MLVNEFLEQSVERLPDKTAIICEDKRSTYLEVEHSSNRLSHVLIEGGLLRQDRAAIYLDSCVEAVESIFSILKAGGVFVVINPQVKAQKVKYILNDCQANVLITDIRHLGEIASILSDCSDLGFIVISDHKSFEENLFEHEPMYGYRSGQPDLHIRFNRSSKRCDVYAS
jgi:long-chain acyl-CoA synthetase